MMRPPAEKAVAADSYSAWRDEAIAQSWRHFSDERVNGRDVLDFGCGEGPLSFYLADRTEVKSLIGVDIDPDAIARAIAFLGAQTRQNHISFRLGSVDGIPIDDQSVDTILAFDCMEHVMDPAAIFAEWHRVLRPGGRVLVEWFPFKGPWGPHMQSLIPIPWAHVLFGERAMFEAAARIYDDANFVPRHWDLDKNGQKKPNKWTNLRSFQEQGYLNQLDTDDVLKLADHAGFAVARMERHGIGDGGPKGVLGALLKGLPFTGPYFTNFVIVEFERR